MSQDDLAAPLPLAAQRLSELEAQVAPLWQGEFLFEHSPTAALLLDPQGCLLRVNRRAAELLGSAAEALVRRQLLTLVDPPSQGTLKLLLEQTRKAGHRQTAEVQGAGRHLLLEATLLPAERGEVYCHLTLTDISSFKRAHQHLLEVTAGQAEQLQAMQLRERQVSAEYEQALKLSKQQIKQRMKRAEALLDQSCHDPEAARSFAEAFVQVSNLLESLDRYWTAPFVRIRRRPVALEQVWRGVLRRSAEQVEGRNVEITAAPLPTVQGDPQVLGMILSEFLMNALKFTRTCEQARLHLHVRETAGEYWLGLEDNGVGFNTRYKDKAFTLFGRLHSEQYEGTGLGLAVVQRLCQRCGARAWGEGKVGQGATFWLAWPKESPDSRYED